MSQAAPTAFPGTSDDDIRHAEYATFQGWPAAESADLDGWICRRTYDTLTRRANSVFAPGGLDVSRGLGEAIDAAEAFYDGCGGAPRFQISPASQPAGLDAALAARGYTSGGATAVMACNALAFGAANETGAVLAEAPDADWRALHAHANPLPGEADGRMRILRRAADRGLDAVYASVRGSDGLRALAAAVAGSGTADQPLRPWALVFGMHTRMADRRQGYGGAIVRALLSWALEKRVETVYLQVETENRPAIAFYRRQGFTELYTYHYRTLIRANKVG